MEKLKAKKEKENGKKSVKVFVIVLIAALDRRARETNSDSNAFFLFHFLSVNIEWCRSVTWSMNVV